MKTLIHLTILITLILPITACNSTPKATPPNTEPSNLTTTIGMTDYLNDLPAVKNVQKWYNDYAKGIIITTSHYKIHTTLLEPLMLRQVPAFFEAAYSQYQNQLPEPVQTKTKFTSQMRRQPKSFKMKGSFSKWKGWHRIISQFRTLPSCDRG